MENAMFLNTDNINTPNTMSKEALLHLSNLSVETLLLVVFFSTPAWHPTAGCYALPKGNPWFLSRTAYWLFAAHPHMWRPFPYPQPGDPMDGSFSSPHHFL